MIYDYFSCLCMEHGCRKEDIEEVEMRFEGGREKMKKNKKKTNNKTHPIHVLVFILLQCMSCIWCASVSEIYNACNVKQ